MVRNIASNFLDKLAGHSTWLAITLGMMDDRSISLLKKLPDSMYAYSVKWGSQRIAALQPHLLHAFTFRNTFRNTELTGAESLLNVHKAAASQCNAMHSC